ncbi:MAG: MFS transporter [Dehalococcoidia bacterium]|nr:MFS transporter [Dehalococcoidia bacterium]
MTSEPSGPQTSGQLRTFAIIAAALFLNNTVALMLGPLLVGIAKEFDTSVAVAGQLTAVTFLSWAIFAPLAGPFSDSFGRRPVALVGLALMGACILAAAFAPNFYVLMILLLGTGMSGAMIPPNSMAAISDVVAPEQRGRAIGAASGISTAAAVIGVPVVAILASVADWRLPFIVCGSLLLGIFVLSWLWYPKGPITASRSFSYFSRFKELGSISVFRIGMVANVSQRIAFYAVIGYLAAFLIDTYGMSVGETALPLAVVGLGAVIGSLWGGVIANHRRRLNFVAGCALAGGATALVLFTVDPSIWVTVFIAFGAVCVLSVGWPVFITFATDVAGQSRATAVGMMGGSNRLGGVIGSSLGGAFLAVGGFSAVGIFCLVTVVISALIMQLFMREPTSQP